MGFKKVGHIHHDSRLEAQTENLDERLAQADGIFFSGGDQLKLTSIYGGTDFLLQLKQRYIHDPVVIAGTSAGAMAMSTPMIYAGNKDVQQMAGEMMAAGRSGPGMKKITDMIIVLIKLKHSGCERDLLANERL